MNGMTGRGAEAALGLCVGAHTVSHNGSAGSFVTLVTAEMFGCKSGIGWYLNWQKSMMLYANVYAGLILLAVLCNLIITLLFRIKDRLLGWQKGVIKW